MRFRKIGTLAVPLVVALTFPAQGRGVVEVGQGDLTAAEIADLYSDSVLQVLVDSRAGAVQQGSGFAIGDAGEFVTSLHLMDGASRVRVRTADGEEHEVGHVLAYDVAHDLVFMRMPTEGVTAVLLGASTALEIGDPIVVIGNPLGLARSVTEGILSARRQPNSEKNDGTTSRSPFGSELLVSTDCELLQISAQVAPGTSGAPVFDRAGQVIGVGSAAIGGGILDLNFAVPVEGLEPLLGLDWGMDLASLQQMVDEEKLEAASEHLQNAQLALDLEELDTADEELRRALNRFPRYVEALLMRSDLLRRGGAYGDAEELLLQATVIRPDSADIWAELGELYLEREPPELGKARESFDRVLSIEPENTRGTGGLGTLLLWEGRVQEGIEMLEAALERDPELLGIGFLLGNAYLERGRFDDARQVFENLLWVDRDYVSAYFGLAICAHYNHQLLEETNHWRDFFNLVKDDSAHAGLRERALKFLRETNPSLIPHRYQ